MFDSLKKNGKLYGDVSVGTLIGMGIGFIGMAVCRKCC